jgi:hypothetical protein
VVQFCSGNVGLCFGQEVGLDKPGDEIVKTLQNIRRLSIHDHLSVDEIQARMIPHK